MTPLSNLVSVLSRRVRDPNQVATSFAFYAQVLSQCQTIVNGALDSVVTSSTLSTTPYGKIYQLSLYLPSALRVVGVRNMFNQDLDPIPFAQLPGLSRTWFRDTGDEYQAWSLAGRDLLILYPALKYASQVTVFYTVIPPALVNTTDISILPTEQDQIMLDLAESIFLLKGRDFTGFQAAMQRCVSRINDNRSADRAVAMTNMGNLALDAKSTD